MHLVADAVVLAVRAHGEHGAVVRALTAAHGMLAGYVAGGAGRRMKPVLVPGNLVRATWRARTETQLAGLAAELVHSRAPLLAEPLAAAGIEWATALTAAVLPEGSPYPPLHAALSALLDAVEAAPSARGWAAALVRYELLLLAELGFGLDLTACVAGGAADDLAWVSPRSGGAVSRERGAPYADRLLPLPAFLARGGAAPDWRAVLDGAAITGRFLERDLLAEGRRADVLAARERLVSRWRRAAG